MQFRQSSLGMHMTIFFLLAVFLGQQSAIVSSEVISLPYRIHALIAPMRSLPAQLQNEKRQPQLDSDDLFQHYLGFGATGVFSPRFGFNGERSSWK
ncbi:unnamed protein product [Nippostrongylus brasiliensis]|uniref:Uncharacterized protein n=1 Tax=Nippostrongylus brasiliensis TaxID=27835 RepID=A0A0N4XZ44_NIPBR|nr:unnamed protein product [Nippostrongylus brasiliensis]